MRTISEIAEGFLKEAAHDSVGLWAIAPRVRRDLALSDNAEVKARTLDVVRVLLDHGLLAGDYDYANSKIHFWAEREPPSIIARIDKEWDPASGDPNLGESICWFALKRK
jgi:hypothetical protein